MKKRIISSSDIYFLIISFVVLIGLVIYMNLLMPVSSEDKWKEIKIPEGYTYSQGISILKEEGMIKNEFVFLVLAKITGTEKKLLAGFYNLNSSMTPLEVFKRLRKGMIVRFIITVPEGSLLEDIKFKLQEKGLVDEESWQLVRDKEFLASLYIDAPSLEGYLYPDTYNFAKGVDPRDIFRMMVQRLAEKFNEPLRERAREIGMNEREILTLASIIEKEALFNRERPLISAVYHNRLKINMRLQADPTVVYGIKRMQDGITKKTLKERLPIILML